MRGIIAGWVPDWEILVLASGMTVVYLVLASVLASLSFKRVLNRGLAKIYWQVRDVSVDGVGCCDLRERDRWLEYSRTAGTPPLLDLPLHFDGGNMILIRSDQYLKYEHGSFPWLDSERRNEYLFPVL